MKNNTWKLAGLAILVIGLAAALISITSEKVLTEQAASLKNSSKYSTSGSAQKTRPTSTP
jgi:hypothetical protein